MSVFLSLIAGFASGIGAAIQSYMAHDESKITPEPRRRSWTDKGRHAERALRVLFFFVCLMMSLAVVVLIVGLLFFVWDTQTPFVAGAMTAPGLAFVLAGGLSIALWMPPQGE
jgi:phosphate/sulfate permease